MSSSETTPRRTYRSTRRALQAAQTRTDVLAAATRLFTSAGWARTTIGAIAAEAGVSAETVYSIFGSKKALLGAAMDVAIVGDDEPVPFVDRVEFASFGEGDPDARLSAGVRVQTDIHERTAGVCRAIIEASAGDPDMDAWRLELERGRRLDLTRSVERIFDTTLDDRSIDVLWVLSGPEVYLRLTIDAGFGRAEYEEYLRDVLVRFGRDAS